MRAGAAAAALLLMGMGVILLSGGSGTSGPVEQGEAALSGERAVRAATQRLLRKQLQSVGLLRLVLLPYQLVLLHMTWRARKLFLSCHICPANPSVRPAHERSCFASHPPARSNFQAYVQALALARPSASAAAFDKTGKPLLPESLALRRMYARDPDDKIKVDDPSTMRRQTTDIGRVFGLGPFGEVRDPIISRAKMRPDSLHMHLNVAEHPRSLWRAGCAYEVLLSPH